MSELTDEDDSILMKVEPVVHDDVPWEASEQPASSAAATPAGAACPDSPRLERLAVEWVLREPRCDRADARRQHTERGDDVAGSLS